MKANIYHWVDKKTHEEFTGSINEYCEKYDILKSSVLYRVRKGRVTRKLVGAKGLRTYTNIENGDSYYGLKKDAREHFGCSWGTLYSKIEKGLIQVDPPEDKTMYYEDKISDPATKRLLNQYYLKKANELACEVEND